MDTLRISRLVACGFLFLAIANLPYGYYRFLRITITVISGINIYFEVEKENKSNLIIFLAIAILFNPIIPIYLNKTTWIPIDFITGLFFGIAGFQKGK